jgi:hypothetical protein
MDTRSGAGKPVKIEIRRLEKLETTYPSNPEGASG